MRFKTDENLHPDASVLLSAHGHDAVTVWDQGLRGTLDENLAQVCKHEGRVLVSLDLDFSDIRTYPPEEFPGILVLRLRSQDSKSVLRFFAAYYLFWNAKLRQDSSGWWMKRESGSGARSPRTRAERRVSYGPCTRQSHPHRR